MRIIFVEIPVMGIDLAKSIFHLGGWLCIGGLTGPVVWTVIVFFLVWKFLLLLSGQLFRGRKGDIVKLLWFDGPGCVYSQGDWSEAVLYARE